MLLAYREAVLGPLLGGLTALTAAVTLEALRLVGIEAAREATVIYQPGGFAYEIYYRCTGFLPVVTLVVAVAACRGPLGRKLAGLAVGIPVLLTVNLVRLVHLFQIGVTNPRLFPFAHGVAWEAGIVLTVLALWLAWLRWAHVETETAPERALAAAAAAPATRRPDPWRRP